MPTIDPIEALRERGRRLVVGPVDPLGVSLVYAVVHYKVPEIAAMPGFDALSAKREAEQIADARARLDTCETDEQREALKTQIDQGIADLKRELLEGIVGSPERGVAYLERCRKVVAGSIVAIGVALEGQEPGPRPMGTRPELVCRALTEGADPLYLRPLTMSLDRSGPVSVLDLSVAETISLATFIAAAFSSKPMVMPLHAGSRSADLGRPAREALPGHEAEHVPARS